MERFVHRQNLEHLRRLIREETDSRRREHISKLLAEEEAKEPPQKKE